MVVTYSQDDVFKRFVNYTGSSTLREGDVLCYDHDNATVANRYYDVLDPTADNLFAFAGVVAPESAGVTGPSGVWVVRPLYTAGVIVQVDTAVVAIGDYLILQADRQLTTAGVPAEPTEAEEDLVVARALEVPAAAGPVTALLLSYSPVHGAV